MFKRTITAAGNPISYIGYAVPFFAAYLLYNIFLSSPASPLQPTHQTILGLVYSLVLDPFILAGLYGAIHAQQKNHGETGMDEFLPNAWRLFWRFAGASLILIIITLVAYVAITAATGTKQGDLVADYIDIPISAVTLFWFAFLAAEGGLFSNLVQATRFLLRNPLALGLGIVWGLFRFADSALLKLPNFQASFTVNVAMAAALTGVRVLAAMYAVALYRQVRGEALEAQQAQAITTATGPVEAASNNGIINAGFGFAFAAFIPLIHVVALVLGILAIRRNKRFILKSAIAVCVGGFFTAFYALILAGWLVTGSGPSDRPGLGFLAQANPSLAQPVALLEQDKYEQVQGQLESTGAGSTGQDWTVNCTLAIARWGNHDMDRALDSFDAAAQQKPDRSEFYFYYGLALLDNDQGPLAAAQFQNASLHGPRLVQAERYASLIQAAYTPPQLVSAAFTILILLLLFTVHEFGHAYVAWKLGDNTAKDRGRLTLNPIAHLDLFGSILLPGILLLRQSGLVFGWAKPVPVNTANFKDPLKDHMRVSFAGPAVNLLVAMACMLVLGCLALVIRLLWPETLSWHFAAPDGSFALVGPPFSFELTILVIFLRQLMYTSLVLGFFNLLPIPPLDGSWILAGILPQSLRNVFDGLRRFGYVIFLILVATPFVDKYLEIPITAAYLFLHFLVSSVGLT